MKKTGIFALLLLMGMWACEYETIEPIVVEQQEDPVSFSTQVAPIFVEVGCTGCHNGAMVFDLNVDKSYANLVTAGRVDTANPATGKLWDKIDTGHGTAVNLTAAQKSLILQWIEEGALEN